MEFASNRASRVSFASSRSFAASYRRAMVIFSLHPGRERLPLRANKGEMRCVAGGEKTAAPASPAANCEGPWTMTPVWRDVQRDAVRRSVNEAAAQSGSGRNTRRGLASKVATYSLTCSTAARARGEVTSSCAYESAIMSW